MKMIATLAWVGLLGIGPRILAVDAPPTTAPAATLPPTTAPSADPPSIPMPPGMTALFDGFSMDGWVYNPANWSIKDNALCGTGAHCMAFTKADYGSFRLLVTSRMVIPVVNKDHLGIIFWGDRPAEGKYDMGKGLNIQPPYGSIWDYRSNKNVPLDLIIPKNDNRLHWHDWHVSEVVADFKTGDVWMAVDAVELVHYKASGSIIPRRGPIGFQIHGGKSTVEYKDIYIQVDPPDDKLLTVK